MTESKWIICSDKLPEDLVPVNITWMNRRPSLYYYFIKDVPFSGTGVRYRGRWYWYSCTCIDILKEYGDSSYDRVDDGIEIVAWMPLPKPYVD